MKFWVLIISLHFSLVLSGLYAQTGIIQEQMAPLNSNVSPVFGTDIIIDDEPLQNQRTVAICSAFNGWLYAAFTHPVNNSPWISILKSVDNGLTWSIIFDALNGQPGDYFTKVDLIACGNDTTNLKLFFGGCLFHFNTNYRTAFVSRFNCSSGVFEDEILGEYSRFVKDLALATDFMYPAANSNPNSIALVYSKENEWPGDTLIFCSSSNGGMSFDYRVGVAGTPNYINKVALTYGRSATYSTGRYFAAWEEKLNSTSLTGHIYSAHSDPGFNSPFTSPNQLDMHDTSMYNKVRNPAIACQFNSADNDSSNLTEVFLCEKYIPTENRFEIAGLYNKKATVSNYFQSFTISSSQSNQLQPDISFNPFDSTFMLTYFDSTEQKLPYLVKNFDMQNPNSWTEISNGYNDQSNLTAPYPRIKLALGQKSVVNAWISEGISGNGSAMFDATFHYPLVIKENDPKVKYFDCKLFPNPTSTFVTIDFELPVAGHLNISLLDLLGQSIQDLGNQTFPGGQNRIILDLSNYNTGIYIIRILADNVNSSLRLSVVR